MKALHKDSLGEFSLGAMFTVILLIMVLVIFVGAIWTTFSGALTNYSSKETVFGPVVALVVPILIGAAILLVCLRELMPGHGV